MRHRSGEALRIMYAIQNVGGIDFRQDIGDTVPVRQTLLGLQRAGHHVSCLQLTDRGVLKYDNVANLNSACKVSGGLSRTRPFRIGESAIRRVQRTFRLPYFAFFDTYRFYEASLRCLPRHNLCHEHNGLFCAGAALACRRLNTPYVLTVSADPLFERAVLGKPMRGLHARVAMLEAKFTYKLARKIICVSEPAKRHMVKRWQLDPEKIVVMPNGVDTLHFSSSNHDSRLVREEFNLGAGPVVAFVGGFQPWHGLDNLVESFTQILPQVPDARLLLVGDGRARPMLDRKVQECGLESIVTITGLLPQARVPAMLAAADVAVLPYPQLAQELWFSPLKLYEYMAAGKAIVASRSGQIADVLENGHNGLLVEPGDVAGLAQAIVTLLLDEATRRRLGRNAKQQAIEKHSWDQYIQRLEEIYWSVL